MIGPCPQCGARIQYGKRREPLLEPMFVMPVICWRCKRAFRIAVSAMPYRLMPDAPDDDDSQSIEERLDALRKWESIEAARMRLSLPPQELEHRQQYGWPGHL